MSEYDKKYRPAIFDEVLGQDHVIKSLKEFETKGDWPHSYLFVGPSGCGKTTLARILASQLKTHPANITEIDSTIFNGVDNIRNLVSGLDYTGFGENPTKFIILDECFAAGTLIATSSGSTPIEQIKDGDMVLNMLGQAKVKHTFANRIPLSHLVKVHLANGKQLTCSRNHLFFTDHGWVKAKNLNKTMFVFSQGMHYTHCPNHFGNLCDGSNLHYLWKYLSKQTYESTFSKSLLTLMRRVAKKTPSDLSKIILLPVPSMQENVYALQVCTHSINMLSYLWKYLSGIQTDWTPFRFCQESGEDGYRIFKNSQSRSLETNIQASFRTNEAKQPIYQSRNSRQSATNQNGKRNSSFLVWKTWWQWLFESATNASSYGFGLESRRTNKMGGTPFVWSLETRSSNQNWEQHIRQFWVSTSIQIRYWLSRFKTIHRSGWRWTRIENECRERFKERSKIDGIGVDYVEVYQRGNNEQSFSSVIGDTERHQNFVTLYDLEIDGHPSYYADECLVHNCHMLTKASWNALLKSIEEPPKHVYFAFCTTEADKVPDTIKTRCHEYVLRSVTYDALFDLLTVVAECEELALPDKALQIIAQESKGSPRRALVSLSKSRGCTSLDEIREIMESLDENAEIIDLCRALAGKVGLDWKKAVRIIRRLDNMQPESIRLTIVNYTAKALLNTDGDEQATKLLAILEAFSKPCNPSEKMAPILLAIGQLLLGE